MKFKTPGQHKDLDGFRRHWKGIAADLDCATDLAQLDPGLAAPIAYRDRIIGNRWVAHPMEGWDGTDRGLPTVDTLRRWARFGTSGAKLVWGGEAFAVRADARANPHQLYLEPSVDTRGGLRELRETLLQAHRDAGLGADDLYVGLQLTHSGRYARPDHSGPRPRIAYRHPVLDAPSGVDSDDAVLSDGELDDLVADFVAAARAAQETGFDFVDVKCCHGYLLHELLGAKTRPGPYGGSFGNRTRFFRNTVAAIRDACPGLDIGVRVSIGDIHPHAPGADRRGEPQGWDEHLPYDYGFGVDARDPRKIDLAEGFRFLELLQSLDIRLVNLTLGSPYYNPHLQRPAAYPPCDGYRPPEDPLHQVAEHIHVTRRCKAAFPGLLLVGTGYSYLQEWLPHVAQHEIAAGHVDFVGIGRMALSYPEMPRDVLQGRELQRRKICRTFSDCTTAPRNGLPSGCYPLDPAYKQRDEAAQLRKIKSRIQGGQQ